MDDSLILICQCHSYTHQAIFWWNEEGKQLSVTIHLNTHRNILRRIWRATRYVFGHTSNFGEWDEFLFKPEDEEKLRDYLQAKR